MTSRTYKSLHSKTINKMRWHLFIGGALCLTSVFTPFSTMYRRWEFDGGNSNISYTEYYIFGIRVARRRL